MKDERSTTVFLGAYAMAAAKSISFDSSNPGSATVTASFAQYSSYGRMNS